MPTYEYKCDSCGLEFERFQPITAAAIKKCPRCGKQKVRRLIGTGSGMIFKGSGFYITDYRDQGYKDKAKADSGGGGENKTESKTEGKAEAGSSGKGESKGEVKPASGGETAKASEGKPAAKADSKGPSKKK